MDLVGMKRLFMDKDFYLPIRWDGKNFKSTIEILFKKYKRQLALYKKYISILTYSSVVQICDVIIDIITDYLAGFPAQAYEKFQRLMKEKYYDSLNTYDKIFEARNNLKLDLYRIVSVEDNVPYERKRIFHTPYNMRSKIGTNRYSIAGYPSLYLATSLELCKEELHVNPYEKYSLAGRFEIDYNSNVQIKVIEFGVKPQDIVAYYYSREMYGDEVLNENSIVDFKDSLRFELLKGSNIFTNQPFFEQYIIWYPLIATCSYIRCNKKDPFAVEYIIPQMLLQWIRMKNRDMKNENYNELIGIRYFSCASMLASEKGFNYVFPTAGREGNNYYCSLLKKCFKLTNPVYINDFETLSKCENYLQKDKNIDHIKT